MRVNQVRINKTTYNRQMASIVIISLQIKIVNPIESSVTLIKVFTYGDYNTSIVDYWSLYQL